MATKGRPRKEPATDPTDTAQEQYNPANDLELIKTKLRKKYFELRNDGLQYDNRDDLLNYVCRILGMGRQKLEWTLEDL